MLERPSTVLSLRALQIKMLVAPGDQRMSSSYPSYLELKVLKGLAGGLLDKEVTWHGDQDSSSGKRSMVEDLQCILQFCKTKSPRSPYRLTDEEGLDIFTNGGSGVGGRQDIDFLDLIWFAFSRATSYSELCGVFKQTLRAIHEEEISPFVSTILFSLYYKIHPSLLSR